MTGYAFSGTTTPHGDKNFLDATVKFGPAPCLYPGMTLTGVVFFTSNEVLAGLTLPDRSDAFVVAGTK